MKKQKQNTKRKDTRNKETGIGERPSPRFNWQHAVLQTIAGAGVIGVVVGVAVVAPNASRMAPLIKKVMKGVKEMRRDRKSGYMISRATKRLLDRGHIKFVSTKHGRVVRLTEKGEESLLRLTLAHVKLLKEDNRPKKWDRKWRVVIYDIRESKRRIRLLLKDSLHTAGFYRLQDSVWVYPYPCEHLHVLLKAHFKIGYEVLYMLSEHIEGDARARKYFDLK